MRAAGPLAGVRILMMGGLGPGPFCGMLLGDLGAEVIRVDRPGEVGRPEPVDVVMRRSQRSIALDAKNERGRELIHTLAERADAFVDVYRPGVAERLGIGPDDLRARNPRLVYARMTGFGQDGPYAQMAGHDINYLALSGALHANGPAERPVPPLNILGDFGGGGMLLAVGLLSGIVEAARSGTGQVIDVSMLEGSATLMAVFYGMLAQGTWRDQRQANLTDGGAHFYRTYETADGRHFAVGALESQFYAELCARLGVDVPQEYDDHEAWDKHGETMAARFRERTRAQWEAELVTPQSCASPVLSLTEAPSHPHNVARGTFVEVDGVTQPAPSPRFSKTPAPPPGRPALPGDQTVEVLSELGLAEETVRGLLADGVARQSG
ncbi:CaiB/BaiF CoA-transferase family protein [Frankia sp. AgB32]|uniref:CaiB/BaiF CoA transferase family protein n=1 Tax=Frankia sp. AgB32 TaxID=631119 RepID=UPI00200C9666|nr:CaiB/BaiF CoA-transferase family protein [Frankia sp. AgB32]MCK9893488.1 CoA transferase [Frankia sp. AgB32]